ncbi:MAG TPA: hypothetical protein VFB82_15530 [Blastocatellia bacterium]|nr:hypothetical protein [Blastocatellia bacterium]
MKKETSPETEDELRPEYDLNTMLKGGVQGKYAKRYRQGTNLVLLAPDVAQAFPTEDAVNEALRLVMRMVQIPVDIESTRSRE